MISIYALINPISNHVFYIGASNKPLKRLNEHIYRAFSGYVSYKCDEIRSILNANRKVDIEILDKCDICKASFLETFYIDLFRSYGFTLKQMPKSAYPKIDRHHQNRDKCSVTINISGNALVAMKIVAYEFRLTKEQLISIALRRYLKRVLLTNKEHINEVNYKLAKEFLSKDKINIGNY